MIWDNNHISIDGAVSLADSTDQVARFAACRLEHARISTAMTRKRSPSRIEAARTSDRPTLIAAKTTIGFGAPTKAGTNKAHGSPLGAEEIAGARKFFGWDYPPFEVPADILDAWRAAGKASAGKRAEWEKRLAAADPKLRAEFERRMRGELPAGFDATIADYKKKLAADKPKVATRKSSEMALEVINGVVPETIGGSADLTGSNNTKTSQTKSDRRGQLRQPLCPLRHSRARHGSGHERPDAAWRHHPLWRHVPVLLRLCAAGDAAGLADGHPLDLRDDP